MFLKQKVTLTTPLVDHNTFLNIFSSVVIIFLTLDYSGYKIGLEFITKHMAESINIS